MFYTIKKGKNNDTRFRFPNIFSGNFKKTWKVSLSPECWYPKELGLNQINKLVGVTEFWSANNKNSVMIGWDPCYLPEAEILEKYPHCKNRGGIVLNTKYFNVYYYTNDENGGHEAALITVVADWRVNDIAVSMQKSNDQIHTYVSAVQFSGDEKTPNYVYAVMRTDGIQFKTLSDFSSGRVIDGKPFTSKKGLFREIFVWFGGTQPAPQDMIFKVS